MKPCGWHPSMTSSLGSCGMTPPASTRRAEIEDALLDEPVERLRLEQLCRHGELRRHHEVQSMRGCSQDRGREHDGMPTAVCEEGSFVVITPAALSATRVVLHVLRVRVCCLQQVAPPEEKHGPR